MRFDRPNDTASGHAHLSVWVRGARRSQGIRDVLGTAHNRSSQADGTARAVQVGRPRLVGVTTLSRTSQRTAHRPEYRPPWRECCFRGIVGRLRLPRRKPRRERRGGCHWLLVGTPPFLSGDLLVGEFVTFLFLTQRFVDPLAGVGRIVNSYENARASGERVFGLTGRTVSVADRPDARPLDVRGRVEFDDVSFAYREGTPVLDGVSFVAEPGETVALVGETGAGKPTVAKLLLRLYDVTEVAVRIDGVYVRDARLAALRDAIGYVSQDVFLFDGTVRENIAYGSFDATGEEIEVAAKAAEAHEFVLELPDGYDTRVGERGVKLSGSQRQRLSIARAMLQDPEILVLDEATSAVDTATELAIQRGLARLTEGRTTLVVAHRLSTVRDADQILVLEGGHVAERGTHDELIDLGGRYAALWGVQTGDPALVDLPGD